MTNYVMLREVCLKHRNNRREIILRVRTQVPSWQRCLFFLSYAARVSQPAPPICGHRPRAGCLNANQAMPVQFRLTAPIFKISQHGGRQLAQLGLQNLAGSGQHRDAVPLFKSRGSQVGRQRPHKPSMSGFDSRPRHQVSTGRSTIQEVTRLASGNAMHGSANSNWPRSANCMAAGAAKHGAKPWRSTISKSREG